MRPRGASVYSGTLNAAAFGSVATGNDAGDRILDAVTSENFCFTVHLPDTTGNAYQGATTSTTFTFAAEQTANN